MEEKKTRMRELTEDDMVGVKSNGNRFMIDFLKNVTKRAAEIFDNEVLSGESYTKMEKKEEKPSSSKGIMFSHKGEKDEEEKKIRACKIKYRFSFEEEISWDEHQLKKPMNRKEERLREKSIKHKVIMQYEKESESPLKNKLKRTASEEIFYNLYNSIVDIPETSGVKKRKNNTSKSSSSGEEVRVVNKRTKIVPDSPPPLPEEFKNAIQELAQGRNISQEILVVQKGLYKSDTERQQNRFSIPLNSVIGEFLKDEEKDHLLKRLNGKLESIQVTIIDPMLIRDKVKLRRWPMKKKNGKESVSYMLTGSWTEIRERNKFEIGNVVQLWSVRIEEELLFCLVRLP
ncbi:unnamed protein product [Fraxinus pennsylvanica]|uniref:TF-B3 domain-containing protein n=1 Tax=Fraxinus pennsylvanica TaxID=56036 RepID=A0AAD1YSQ2_9LAMI|nr:unnamed protein product [Fraxinus pennsylvanica]